MVGGPGIHTSGIACIPGPKEKGGCMENILEVAVLAVYCLGVITAAGILLKKEEFVEKLGWQFCVFLAGVWPLTIYIAADHYFRHR